MIFRSRPLLFRKVGQAPTSDDIVRFAPLSAVHLVMIHITCAFVCDCTTALEQQVLGCCFEADGGVVTCGEKHALFWKKEGRCLVKKNGVFGRKAAAQVLLCCSSLKGKVCLYCRCGCCSPYSFCAKTQTNPTRLSCFPLFPKAANEPPPRHVARKKERVLSRPLQLSFPLLL